MVMKVRSQRVRSPLKLGFVSPGEVVRLQPNDRDDSVYYMVVSTNIDGADKPDGNGFMLWPRLVDIQTGELISVHGSIRCVKYEAEVNIGPVQEGRS